MTREEAIAYGKECLSWNKFSKGMKMYQFIEMAIQALEQNESAEKWYKLFVEKLDEQEPMRDFTKEEAEAYSKVLDKMYKPTGFNVFDEPCDDAISRQAVLSIIDGWYEQNRETENIEDLIILITYMDSVTPKSGECEDVISRAEVKRIVDFYKEQYDGIYHINESIDKLPSVTQKSGKCKNCKYFEYDSVAKVDGVPLIVAHEICSKWGAGCKTSEDGYCYLFEPQESEE